jgi:peptidoglycan/LPS O-acetylase OafA/YrhL
VLIGLLVGSLGWYRELRGHHFILESHLVLDFAPFFFFGSLLALFKIENMPFRKIVITVLFLLFLISILVTTMNLLDYSKFFILPPLIILFGLESMPFVNRAVEKLGDISYGVYIYAFPVQQTLMHFFTFNAMELMVYSLIITCILGYGSWHLIEKRVLRFKKVSSLNSLN